MTDDPNFYHRSQITDSVPPRPLSVTGFTFDPATRVIDFSAVSGFDLSRLQYLWNTKSQTYLYARPVENPLNLAEVDGVPIPAPPTSGTVLKLKVDTSGMSASDEIIAAYNTA